MSVVTVRDTEQLMFVFIYNGEVFPFLQSVRLGMGAMQKALPKRGRFLNTIIESFPSLCKKYTFYAAAGNKKTCAVNPLRDFLSMIG